LRKRRCGRFSDQEVYEKVFKIRRKKVLAALYWLVEHNVLYQEFNVVIDPSNLNWMGDDNERLLPINCTIDTQDYDTPEDYNVGPSTDQNLMEHLNKIDDLDLEVSGTLDNTDCTIPTPEDAEILEEIRNSRTGNDKGKTVNWPSFSDTKFRMQ
jgi:hypothetical protein